MEYPRGRQAKTKIGDPRGGWVGQSTKKGWGRICFLDIFYRVFELPSPSNAQKRDKRNRETIGFGFLVDVFFDTMFFSKHFFSVFEIPSLRNTRKRDTTKNVEKTLTSIFLSICLGKVFDIDFFVKILLWRFLTPLAEKRPKTY
jgi:hypothetical protein